MMLSSTMIDFHLLFKSNFKQHGLTESPVSFLYLFQEEPLG